MNTTDCKPCEACPLWKELSTNPIYQNLTQTRTIGGEEILVFQFLSAYNEVKVSLPRSGRAVKGYPTGFNSDRRVQYISDSTIAGFVIVDVTETYGDVCQTLQKQLNDACASIEVDFKKFSSSKNDF